MQRHRHEGKQRQGRRPTQRQPQTQTKRVSLKRARARMSIPRLALHSGSGPFAEEARPEALCHGLLEADFDMLSVAHVSWGMAVCLKHSVQSVLKGKT